MITFGKLSSKGLIKTIHQLNVLCEFSQIEWRRSSISIFTNFIRIFEKFSEKSHKIGVK